MTDAILKKTRDIAICGRDEWVSTTLLVDSQIRGCAVEDADVGAQRAHSTEVTRAMKLVLWELEKLADVAPKSVASQSTALDVNTSIPHESLNEQENFGFDLFD